MEIKYNDIPVNKPDADKFNEIKRAVNSKLDRAARTNYLNNEVSFTPRPFEFDLISNLSLGNNFTLNAPLVYNEKPYEDGMTFVLRLRSSGIVNLTFDVIYRVLWDTLPTATTADKMIMIGFCYNAIDKVWDVIAVNTQT